MTIAWSNLAAAVNHLAAADGDELFAITMPCVTARRETAHHLALVLPFHVRRRMAGPGDEAGSKPVPVSGAESAAAHRLAAETAATKRGGVRTASAKAASPVETTAAEASVEAASPAAARRHNVGCKHSKCCSRQQCERDFAEHD